MPLTSRAALRDIAAGAVAGLGVFGYLYAALRIHVHGMGAPLRFSHDSLVYLAQIKATVENGWWWFNPAIGAPQGFEALLFPSNSNVDQAYIWILSWFSRDAMTVANATWMLLVGFSAITAFWSLRTLGVSRATAASCGALFALSPYALYRNLEHFSLVTYLVPPVCALALQLATADARGLRWDRCRGLIAGAILLGFNYIYYAFFGCFVLMVGVLIGWASSRRLIAVRHGVIILLLVISCTTLNLVPTFDAYRRLGVPVTVDTKRPAESEQYGLKIRHLVSPVFQHPLPLFDRWARQELDAGFPLDNENQTTRLGLVTAVGFLSALSLVILRVPSAAGTPLTFSLAAGQLIVAMLVLATIGGFGSLFSLLITPDIRGWNRICPFIAFMSLVPVAAAFDRLRYRFPAAAVLLVPALAFGAWDQSAALNALGPRQPHADEYASIKTMVDRLAAVLPPRSMVLQLPFVMYLRETGSVRMLPYDHLKPYLASANSLRWSYPAMTNAQVKWQQAAAVLSTEDLASAAAADGFSAILVDTAAYPDAGQNVLSGLRAAGARSIADQGRYRAFSLIDVRRGSGVDERTPTMPTSVCAGAPLYFIDAVNDKRHPAGNEFVLSLGEPLGMSGWFVIPSTGHAASAMDIVIDGTASPAAYGFDRPDVAAHFGDPDYQPSGFRVVVPANELTAGTHSLRLLAVAKDRSCYVETPPLSIIIR